MARKLSISLSLLALVLVLTSACFANIVPTQITFGPNTTGSVGITNTAVKFASVTGVAWQQNAPQGTFSLSGGTFHLTGIGPNTYTLGPNSQTFTINIGGGTLSGLMSVSALYVNSTYGFFAGSYVITSTSPNFVDTGFPVGATVDIDFVTYKGNLSSGEVNPDPVPEPGTIAMLGSGLLAVGGVLRRKL